MNFLEAHRLLRETRPEGEFAFTLAMSGTAKPLELFVQAYAARQGKAARIEALPFNTLGQWLRGATEDGDRSVLLLTPWDLAPELDWRSGVPSGGDGIDACLERAETVAALVRNRRPRGVLYLDAPVPPFASDRKDDARLAARLRLLALETGAETLPADCFSLGACLLSGCPIAGSRLDTVAEAIVRLALSSTPTPKKLLITDFDNVMWRGVIAEDGPDGVHCEPEGVGYVHFLYQTLLLKVKEEGGLIAGVSRNNRTDALTPFRTGGTVLAESDLIAVVAGYGAKSAAIRAIAEQVNLSTRDVVFVDDNEIELAEVAAAIPEVIAIRFPDEAGFPDFAERLALLFSKAEVTAEDRRRTELYRRRVESMPPPDSDGADLTEFLRGLGMTLAIHDRTGGDRARAIQLINKTNQFNLNGRRLEMDEVARQIAGGGRLYTASLRDRAGDHGEILACLLDGDGVVRSFVLSCRVFQRRVEHAFLDWLIARCDRPILFDFHPTDRNEPLQTFIHEPGFRRTDGLLALDAAEFADRHAAVRELFKLVAP